MYKKKTKKGIKENSDVYRMCLLTSISCRLRMWIPACCPLLTRSALGVSIRTMVFTECSLSFTQLSTRSTLSTTSHTIIEMEAAETCADGSSLPQFFTNRNTHVFMLLHFTSVYNVADGLCSQCVVQRD